MGKVNKKDVGGDLPVPSSGLERGEPSQYLKNATIQTEGGIVDSSSDYEPITEAAAETGVFTIVGGYVDEQGEVHNEVHVRSMSGREEELLSNDNIDILDRLNGLMVSCTERIGTITDKGQIIQAINRMPMGSRLHLLVCLRRVTHWKRHKDMYEMDIRCPIDNCQKVGSYELNLGELEMYEMAEPDKREFTEELLDSEKSVVWRVASAPQEKILRAISSSNTDDFKMLTYSIMVRLSSIDGNDVRMRVDDFVHNNKLKLSKRASDLYNVVVGWTSGDREQLREKFLLNEPDIETEIDIQCQSCKREFKGVLDIKQRTFFFPSATSRRSKRRSST